MTALVVAVALSLSVSPRIAMSPATVRARVQFDAGASVRRLLIALVSADYEQRTEIPIARVGRQTHWIAPWLRVPAGDYTVIVALVDASGAITAHESMTVHIAEGLP